jgi:hypothetical protein
MVVSFIISNNRQRLIPTKTKPIIKEEPSELRHLWWF